jgi:uncharacterized protein (DUF1800 family)
MRPRSVTGHAPSPVDAAHDDPQKRDARTVLIGAQDSATTAVTSAAGAVPAASSAAAAAAAAAAALSGCATAPAPGAVDSIRSGTALSDTQAARFLSHAAFAATPEAIGHVQRVGLQAWLDEQMAIPRGEGHVQWMLAQGYGQEKYRASFQGVDNTLWRRLMGAPDALRQRMTLALSEIFVVSMQGLPGPWRGLMAAHYVDLLEEHAFGRYRELLEAITLSPAMGLYLNMRGNRRGDAATGRVPDENYAREVLQLFSIGLNELREDGTPRTDWRGRTVDTYGQDTVSGLARVFTGWNFDRFDRNSPEWALRPMTFTPARHDGGSKGFLGLTLPAGTPGPQALRQALDHIASHPNVGPFIGRQLIQRLVTSNPSPAYVKRVARAFADNGAGVRGDLAAVLRAVLLDPEARRDPAPDESQAGRLREPQERFIQWARTFRATSTNGQWAIGSTAHPALRLGQSPLRAPSVFNFFRPGYVPPTPAFERAGLRAPELQIAHESSVMAWVNFAQQFVAAGVADVRPDYSREIALAQDPSALVRHLDLLLAAGGLSSDTQRLITAAVSTMPDRTQAQQRQRVHAAVHLVLCAPEYLVMV